MHLPPVLYDSLLVNQPKITTDRIHSAFYRVSILLFLSVRRNHSHSMALFLSSRHSSCTQFSVPSRDECRQVTPCRVSSASGTKAGTTPKTFFKLKGIEFLFLSQRARRTAFGGSISPKTPVLKLNRPLACKPPASTASESALVVFEPFAKPQVTGLWYRWAK